MALLLMELPSIWQKNIICVLQMNEGFFWAQQFM